MNIWILRIDHKHGENISAHTTEKLAEKELYTYIRDNWDDGLDEQYDLLENLTPKQATEHYFECHANCLDPETYILEMLPIHNWEWSNHLDKIDHPALDTFIAHELTSEPSSTTRLVNRYNDATPDQRNIMDDDLVDLTGWTIPSLLKYSQGEEV